ncbi:hypothetical protein RO865_18095 [Blautia faecis]|uniref:PspA/IM30 family protein n=1 Tax=Blautia faecis TaxID=871665 RepID=UPI0028A4DB55|nr:hypothetical protein [Blautia faecis]MDT4370687.1 hypothetical protein [Blautia faecis]
MKITFGAILLIVIVLLILLFLLRTKTGKRLRLRASGTAAEAITKDASTPEGAKAYYNVAIEKKENDLAQANTIYSQMLGKIANYEDQLRGYKKDLMKAEINVNSCVEKNNDEGAKVYLKEQQDLEEKVAIIKDALTGLKENAKLQEETVNTIKTQLSDLKAEKDNAILTLETAQVTKSLQATPGMSSLEEDKMLEKVRDGVKKQKEAADGTKIAYENSASVQKQRLDQKIKDEEIEKKLAELKARKK